MIGTNIRSIRHLFRVSDTSLKTALIKFKENAYEVCKVVKTQQDSPFGEHLFIFNNSIKHSNWSWDSVVNSKWFRDNIPYDDIREYSRLFSISLRDISNLEGVFSEITLLPTSFQKDYDKFLKENSKMINGLVSSFGFNTRDSRIIRLYLYSDGSKNFFQWAVNACFKNGISMSTIKGVLLWNESYKQLAKNLSKGTITAYTSKDSIIPLLGELSELRKEKRINDSINSFNTAQKKMLKENKLNDDVRQALWRLSRLSDTKRLNFIKKMSSVTDFNELSRQLKFVTSVHFSWSKESFMDFIDNVEEIKYEKIFENENVVLIKTLDYETIKQLGKTTNWCISKNKHYWNNYIENYHGQTTQYMVFDFSKIEDDKLSIIGFTTTRNRGITSAHNFVNDDLMGIHQNDQVLLNSFIARFKENGNIYSILCELGIDITLVAEYDAPPYEWKKENLITYLYECVDKNNIDVLKEDGDKIVLSVVDKNICYFFGDTYQDNISSEYHDHQHIIFIDFSKNKYDFHKIQFGIIEEGFGDEDYCVGVYNERCLNDGKNFDSLLIEYGLPYNTIRRTNNPRVRLKNAICSFNMPMINEIMKDFSSNDLLNVLKQDIGKDSLYDYIFRSIETHMSFDYLDLLYNHGIKLKDVLSVDYIGDLIKNFANNIRARSRSTRNFTNMEGVTNEEIRDFYAMKTEGVEDTKYIGFYAAFKKIVENEKVSGNDANVVFRRFISYMDGVGKSCDIFEQMANSFKDALDYNNRNSQIIVMLARYTAFYASQEFKDFMEKKAAENKFFGEQLTRYKSEYDRIMGSRNETKRSAEVFVTSIANDINPLF